MFDQNNDRYTLQLVDTKVGKETLRVYLDPEGNNLEAVCQMLQKAWEWRDSINVGHIICDIHGLPPKQQ